MECPSAPDTRVPEPTKRNETPRHNDADGAFGIRIGGAVLTDRHKEAVDRWSRRQGQGRTRFKNPKNRVLTFKPARIKGYGKNDQEGGSARKTTPDSAIKNPLFLDRRQLGKCAVTEKPVESKILH